MADRIELITKAAQSVAVILGIILATNELILKDRDHERQLLELTIKQLDVGLSVPVQEARKRLFALMDFADRTPGANPNDPPSILQDDKMRSDVKQRFDNETRELAYFYNTIARCYEAGYCMKNLVLALLCEEAYSDLSALDQLNGRVGNRAFRPRFFQGLVRLQHACPGQKPIDTQQYLPT